MNETKILVVDIETTGFLNQGGSIVEIGIAELCLATGSIKMVYDSLLKEHIFSKTHTGGKFGWIFKNSDLTFEEVMDAPAAVEVLLEVQDILNEYPLGATAYNHNFDFGYLRNRGVVVKNLADPMQLCTNILKLPGRFGDYKWPKVQEAYDFFFPNNDYIEKHRGADDAVHEAEIVYELFKRGIFLVPGFERERGQI